MKKFLNLRKDNAKRVAIPAWRRFSTGLKTISVTGAWEVIEVPTNAAEVVLVCSSKFYYGESATAVGASKKEIQLGILDMENIYVKGTAGQEIEITWGLL